MGNCFSRGEEDAGKKYEVITKEDKGRPSLLLKSAGSTAITANNYVS
jgi:hypothetical protein